VGFLALSLMGAPVLFAQPNRGQQPAQRGGAPNADTPQILVGTFASTTPGLGVEVGDEVRSRIQGEHSAKDLYVVTKTNIDNALIASGYKPDSALNPSDMMELARITHGDYVLDGHVVKGGNVLHADTRLMLKIGQNTLSQPLPVVDGRDAGEVAKLVERNITEALKQMPPYKACIADLRAQKFDQAVKDGGLAIAAYPNSTLARVCELQAFSSLNQTDSVIAVAQGILSRDSSSTLALGQLVGAYTKKADKDKAMQYTVIMWRRDPSNQDVAKSLIQQLVESGSPDAALPIVDSMLVQNPADPEYLGTKWKLQLAGKHWKEAIATGEQLAKLAPPATDSAALDYYNRMVGAAQADSNPAKIIELASKASQKFPKDVSFENILALNYRKTGQLQEALRAATRATELDPKNTNAWLIAVATAKDLNQPDTAAALAQRGIAAGADKTNLAPFLLGPVTSAINKAQASKSQADWQTALDAAQKIDANSPTPQTKFYVGVSSFQVGVSMMENVQELAKGAQTKKDDRAPACAAAKGAEDMFATTATAMPAGGTVDKTVAGQIMTALTQYTDYIGQVKKAFCK
jgi:tetratricopeptide (TPR) repeat protein